MKRKKVSSKRPRKNSFARRGQMMILFALLIPMIMLFFGLAFDVGWYYLNVSRLQNAADAAALAGARGIIDDNSAKMQDLLPVLVHLPEDDGLLYDTTPTVETSSSTETKTSTTETEAGTKKTTTTTTTTTTKTTSKTKLEDISTDAGKEAAQSYVAANLSAQDVSATKSSSTDLIIDAWNTFAKPDDRKVDTDLNLIKLNGELYYIVTLTENIKHFFLSGWFGGMNAKVIAIAQLVPKDQVSLDTSTDVKTMEEFIEKLEDAKNQNVIVGNWEVQNYYRYIKTKEYIYSGETQLTDDTITRAEEYSRIYTSD